MVSYPSSHMEAMATRKALIKARPNVRPFVLTRSSFSGTGAHAAHWLGDNWSTFQSMQLSLPGALNFQLFGIPMVGPDICGFNGDATEELCARWMEVGAFFPFSRNHNSIDASDQEPYRWSVVAEATRRALKYTLLHLSSTDGELVLQALAWVFPEDSETYSIERQFLVGNGILVSPVLEDRARDVVAYFPQGVWYDLASSAPVISVDVYGLDGRSNRSTTGQWIHLEADIFTIPVHVRGGSVIPQFDIRNTDASVLPETVAQLLKRGEYSILVALDENGKAEGRFYLDDGESIAQPDGVNDVYVNCENGRCTWKGSSDEILNATQTAVLTKITVIGLDCGRGVLTEPKWVAVNGDLVEQWNDKVQDPESAAYRDVYVKNQWFWSAGRAEHSGRGALCGTRKLQIRLRLHAQQEFAFEWA
ncbi:hypothetical protein HDU93_008915 [Gonapodya sp. JEL0774]|nr:hypothetical protein HDU93_008915 [Gonapodya sp. JEL0774]